MACQTMPARYARAMTFRRLLPILAAGLLCVAPAPAETPKDIAAVRFVAEKGDAEAQCLLGELYAGEGVTKDEVEAAKWYRKAAEQGLALAQNNLGVMYDHGLGVPMDEAEAVKWYRKAAEQGDPKAQTNLGLKYASGRVVPKDETEAYKWLLLAGAQGDENAKKFIKVVEPKLPPAQRMEGQRMAREFKPSKPK